MKKPYLLVTIVLALSLFMATSSSAYLLTLDVPNTLLSPYPGPYATVGITLDAAGTHADVVFTGLTNSGNIYLLAGAQAADLNVNGAFSVGPITGVNSFSGFSPGPFTSGSGNADGFGSFNLTIDSFDGIQNASETISFTLTKNTGTWASDADVLTPNTAGFPAAAHIFVWDGTYTNNVPNTALATGFASVPIPAAAWLLGSGLIGLVAVRRRMRK
jgi:hypothetical protein